MLEVIYIEYIEGSCLLVQQRILEKFFLYAKQVVCVYANILDMPPFRNPLIVL